MANSANLPAPYGGQNTNTPQAVLSSPSCLTLFNFNTTEAGISLRNGDAKWTSQSLNTSGGVTIEEVRGLVQYGQSKLFQAVSTNLSTTRYYDISTKGGAPSLAYTSASGIGGTIYSTYFNKRVFTFGSFSSTGDYYDGTSWGAWTYTMPASFNPIGGCVYKNRQYFVGRASSDYGYSKIDAVSGEVTKVPLGGVVAEDSNLAIITPVSISKETSSVKLLAFVFFTGEVLFYSGSYPDSASWSLVATANLGQVLSYNAVIQGYQGDSLVACSTGLVSLRDLFLQGSEAALSLVLSRSITPDWQDLVSRILFTVGPLPENLYIGLAWWKIKNKIIVQFPYTSSAPSSGAAFGSTYFVFDTLRLSWSVHRSVGGPASLPASLYLVTFKNEVLFCGGPQAVGATKIMIKSKENATDFQDVNYDDSTKTSYDFEMLSAPIPFPKTAVYEATQIEPILESDLYAETNYNLVADFGRQTSGNQKTDAGSTAVAKPAVNVGMQNITYVQAKISGTTVSGKTVGLSLYSYNIWYNAGDKGSR